MFEITNSIEPIHPQRARQEEPAIREATRAEMRRHMQPSEPIKAVGWFSRAPKKAVEPDNVSRAHGFYVAQKRNTRTYFADYQQKSEVMRAQPDKISSKLSDRQTVTAMLDLAQSHGWAKIKLRGTEEFKAEAWVQAQVRGIMTEGYRASDTDKQEVARRKQAAGPIEAVPKTAEPIKINAAKPPEVAKGWTEAEAKQMDAHISQKVAKEAARTEPTAAATRLAERQADATDPMHDKRREAQANAHKPMTPKQQAKDYERVNGAADRARAAEVKQHGSDGYKGDPGVTAAEKRAEKQGDATTQSLPKVKQTKRNEISPNVWGNADVAGAKMRALETAKQVKSAIEKAGVRA